MAKGTSAEKAHRESLRRREINRHRVRTVRTLVRKAREATAAKADDRAEKVKSAVIELDRAAVKGTLHKNAAARHKSRMMKRLNRSSAEGA